MTTVLITDYPADSLPAELRKGIGPGARVKVEVTELDEPVQKPRVRAVDLMGRGAGVYPTPEAADAYIRALRDEWG